MKRTGYRYDYENALAVRNTEMQVAWNRYNIQAALNLGLLVAFTTRDFSVFDTTRKWLPVAGLLMSGLWFWLTYYSGKWVEYWERELQNLESMHPQIYPLFRHAYRNPPPFTGKQALAAAAPPAFLAVGWLIYGHMHGGIL